ncbi:uncharacterized protein [Physcomitrium patens]|uniref:uncharacterized protein n=1 Tax=Physcomitrium patens TaxID=3218 RepID=UPI003CCDF52F
MNSKHNRSLLLQSSGANRTEKMDVVFLSPCQTYKRGIVTPTAKIGRTDLNPDSEVSRRKSGQIFLIHLCLEEFVAIRNGVFRTHSKIPSTAHNSKTMSVANCADHIPSAEFVVLKEDYLEGMRSAMRGGALVSIFSCRCYARPGDSPTLHLFESWPVICRITECVKHSKR